MGRASRRARLAAAAVTGRRQALNGIDRALALLARYGAREAPPHYLPPPAPELEALMRTLERIK